MADSEDEVDEELLSSKSTGAVVLFGSSPCSPLAQRFGFGQQLCIQSLWCLQCKSRNDFSGIMAWSSGRGELAQTLGACLLRLPRPDSLNFAESAVRQCFGNPMAKPLAFNSCCKQSRSRAFGVAYKAWLHNKSLLRAGCCFRGAFPTHNSCLACKRGFESSSVGNVRKGSQLDGNFDVNSPTVSIARGNCSSASSSAADVARLCTWAQ